LHVKTTEPGGFRQAKGRHTNATLLLSLEVPIETVSKILGYADIQTTQIYAKVIDKSKRDAVDKLDELTGEKSN
jgi:site-specific recombinase XerC